ncbi:putative membrane protein [Leptospira fainei serovar Hurstbridge str. BUT 6]|uniref:Membrane protein n=1 Tax=Leptospira fainei serovar Hurstbridge str. BUT 6 TaxID=1193011 RepID=S3W1Z9_9LEPT|nr:putative membrane protein [Leptospira fainei serovar Hurstbridge str. BUT 6]
MKQESLNDLSVSKRLLSIDALRGFTVAGMILVNNPGSWSAIYLPLRHAKWFGCTPTDLVFPFFLFSVGVSIPFSAVGNGGTFFKILKRASLLIIIGLFLHWFGEWSFDRLRIPGVLQRIGLVYFISAIIYRSTNFRIRITICLSILLGYWILLGFVPPPSSDSASLSPGKDWGAWLDRIVFGENHLWKSSKTWDPEGLLSSFSAVATTLLGTFFGEGLKKDSDTKRNIQKTAFNFCIAAIVIMAVGWIWHQFFPMNKSLWTSSYVLWTGGLAALLLALFLFLESISMKNRDLVFAPWIPFGRNAILVFFASGIWARVLNLITIENSVESISLKTFLFQKGFVVWAPSLEFASLAYALSNVILWFGILYVLDKKKLYWKI